MKPSVWLLPTLVFPLMALSQTFPTNETVFGSGIPSDSNALLYYDALTRPFADSIHTFQGFNLTVPISSASSTSSSETWSLILNNDIVPVPATAGNTTTSNTAFALSFGGSQSAWPQGSTDWQLCAGIMRDEFPVSVSSKTKSDATASCTQYLGDACVVAWSEAYRRNSVGVVSGCPVIPLLADVRECASQLDGAGRNSVFSEFPISNATEPGLIYYSANRTYISAENGTRYTPSNVSYRGLTQAQWFAHQRVNFANSPNLNASVQHEARRLHLVGLSLIPTTAAAAKANNSFQPDVRMLCARADTLPSSGASGLCQAVPLLIAVGLASMVSVISMC